MLIGFELTSPLHRYLTEIVRKTTAQVDGSIGTHHLPIHNVALFVLRHRI